MRNEDCTRMRKEYISMVVNLLFETGRHDRSKKWIWHHFIRPFVGMEYQTFLKETNPELLPLDRKRLAEMVAKYDLLIERAKLWLEKEHCQDMVPKSKQIDEVLKQIEELEQ